MSLVRAVLKLNSKNVLDTNIVERKKVVERRDSFKLISQILGI